MIAPDHATLDGAANLETSRAKRLKADTSDAHGQLDKRIMEGDPFCSVGNYSRFLQVQYHFHRDIAALYDMPELQALIPDLTQRRRLEAITQDLQDLFLDVPQVAQPPKFAAGHSVDLATALGWLYVAEGSNLGAAFLLKMAKALGLDENYGARHLAGHPDGRALHWRGFTEALDSLTMDGPQEERLAEGAREAFRKVHGQVDRAFG